MKNIFKLSMISILAILAILSGCKDDDEIVNKVTGVTLNKTTLTLVEATSETLVATIQPEEATNKTITWRSSDNTIATVDNNGLVTALKAGNTTITVTTEDGNKTASCKVTVKAKVINVTEVKLDQTEISRMESETKQLTVTVLPDNATDKTVTWSSSNNSIVTVSDSGLITAIKKGVATITVASNDGNKTATCKVTVRKKVSNKMTFTTNKKSVELVIGAQEADKPDVWIDLNGNGTREDNEIVTYFSSKTTKNGVNVKSKGTYTLQTNTVTVYGKITYFVCIDNELTALDISENNALTHIECGHNLITTLDLSKNTQLIRLISNNTKLKQLDVTNNTKLTYLDCSENRLSQLDISKNTQLEQLNSDSNRLKQLNVANNTKLTALACSENKLSQLDVSKNINLYSLFCLSNQLTYLDLSKNVKLTIFDCHYNEDLAEIKINPEQAKNKISKWRKDSHTKYVCGGADDSFNISMTTDNKDLKLTINAADTDKKDIWIDLNGNKMRDENEVVTKFSENEVVTYQKKESIKTITIYGKVSLLKCQNNSLQKLDISQNPVLTTLDCFDNDLTELNVSNNKKLSYLGCGANKITTLDVTQNKQLTVLDCRCTDLTSLDVTQNTALETLVFHETKISSIDISKNTNLKWLMFMRTPSMSAIDISKNINLEQFIGFGCNLSSLDISKNTKLKMLRCDENQLTSLDARNNPELTEISCSGNQLTSLEMKNNTKLTFLRCEKNQLTSLDVSGSTELTEFWCQDNKLKSLDVSKNIKLSTFYSYGNPELHCIQVNQTQLNNIPEKWFKDPHAKYNTNCGENGGEGGDNKNFKSDKLHLKQ